jgi:hypothetical protein
MGFVIFAMISQCSGSIRPRPYNSDVQHFFVQYLFILENEVWEFQI